VGLADVVFVLGEEELKFGSWFERDLLQFVSMSAHSINIAVLQYLRISLYLRVADLEITREIRQLTRERRRGL